MELAFKRLGLLALLGVLHAALTVVAFLMYMDYAIKVDHDLISPSTTGTILQYMRSTFLRPVLLPALRWRPDLAVGLWGYILILLNSSLWIWAGWFLWQKLRRNRA